ncbi:MAG: DUF2490 domain-containing protein [Flavobacteriia bacterium]|nr:DUF2490 domain-containing protein [Flavobacteriia bacterium]
MKQKIIISIFLLGSLKATAQTTDTKEVVSRNSFWTETVFNGVVKNKWKWQLDYQYRRTSDLSDMKGHSNDLFKNNFQHVYRPWIHYQMNENVRLSLSPLGFWETYTSAFETGSKRIVQPEFRICPQVTLTNKIFDRVIIDQRYRYEFRWLGSKANTERPEFLDYSYGMAFHDNQRKMRMRYFLRATIPLNHKTLEKNTLYITAWNELFIGLGKNTANDKIWDQNRSFILLGYKPKWEFPMRFEIGYSAIYKNMFTSKIIDGQFVETGHKIEKNNILQVYVIFENFNKLFKRKAKQIEPAK